MDRYLQSFAAAAELLRDVTFLRLLLPVLLVVGVALLSVWGVRGLVHRRTYIFGRGPAERLLFGEVEGVAAVFVGALHLVVAAAIVATLGPLSYFLWVPR